MFTLNTNTADRFIDWLVSSFDWEDLAWTTDAGTIAYTQPGCDLFYGADDALFDAWEDLNYGQQRQCIMAAAEWMKEIETMRAEIA